MHCQPFGTWTTTSEDPDKTLQNVQIEAWGKSGACWCSFGPFCPWLFVVLGDGRHSVVFKVIPFFCMPSPEFHRMVPFRESNAPDQKKHPIFQCTLVSTLPLVHATARRVCRTDLQSKGVEDLFMSPGTRNASMSTLVRMASTMVTESAQLVPRLRNMFVNASRTSCRSKVDDR